MKYISRFKNEGKEVVFIYQNEDTFQNFIHEKGLFYDLAFNCYHLFSGKNKILNETIKLEEIKKILTNSFYHDSHFLGILGVFDFKKKEEFELFLLELFNKKEDEPSDEDFIINETSNDNEANFNIFNLYKRKLNIFINKLDNEELREKIKRHFKDLLKINDFDKLLRYFYYSENSKIPFKQNISKNDRLLLKSIRQVNKMMYNSFSFDLDAREKEEEYKKIFNNYLKNIHKMYLSNINSKLLKIKLNYENFNFKDSVIFLFDISLKDFDIDLFMNLKASHIFLLESIIDGVVNHYFNDKIYGLKEEFTEKYNIINETKDFVSYSKAQQSFNYLYVSFLKILEKFLNINLVLDFKFNKNFNMNQIINLEKSSSSFKIKNNQSDISIYLLIEAFLNLKINSQENKNPNPYFLLIIFKIIYNFEETKSLNNIKEKCNEYVKIEDFISTSKNYSVSEFLNSIKDFLYANNQLLYFKMRYLLDDDLKFLSSSDITTTFLKSYLMLSKLGVNKKEVGNRHLIEDRNEIKSFYHQIIIIKGGYILFPSLINKKDSNISLENNPYLRNEELREYLNYMQNIFNAISLLKEGEVLTLEPVNDLETTIKQNKKISFLHFVEFLKYNNY